MSTDGGKVFYFSHFPASDVSTFRDFARLASRMKAHGRVIVGISSVAEKAWHEVPEGGSAWHDYADCNAALMKFFPHPQIAPHLPAEWVAKNRALLLAKAAVLRELGMEAAFAAHEPCFLPESFFERHPHLRGPRIDHPRRSRQEAFALCTDLDETLAMYEWMAAELKRNVPGLACFAFKTNDAGAGLCWAAAQYAGSNGPRHCQGRPVGARVRAFVEALARGAEKGGGRIDIRIEHSNFWRNEQGLVEAAVAGAASLGTDGSNLAVPGMLGNEYPVLGLMDPLALIETMESWTRPGLRTVVLPGGTMYQRAHERLDTIEKTLDIVEDAIREPVAGLLPRLNRLRRHAVRWGGERHADALVEAFAAWHDGFGLAKATAPQFHAYYRGASSRYITRPLLIRPEALTPEEESYFLPHVFSIHEAEARSDYIETHGGRMTVAPIAGPFQSALASVRSAAGAFEKAADAPEGKWLARLGSSLRLWAGIMRSCHNFYFGQAIRDRNREALAGPPRLPPKVGTWDGHPDILPWNELMRDEYDNTLEMIGILEAAGDGGRQLMVQAPTAREQDTFLLGPDLIGDLKKKARLMREHWLDVEKYLATPHK